MSEHTKEPWNYVSSEGEDETVICPVCDDAWIIAVCCDGVMGNKNANQNAARIVSCVNACAEMADPSGEISTLKAQRDELLKAENRRAFRECQLVEALKAYIDKYGPGYSCTDRMAYDNATGVLAAIANAERPAKC